MAKKSDYLEQHLGDKGVGGRNEAWYTVVRDQSGRWFHVHRWSDLPFDGPIDSGSKSTPLAEANEEPYYQDALAFATKNGFKA